jgi:hypothetical protein
VLPVRTEVSHGHPAVDPLCHPSCRGKAHRLLAPRRNLRVFGSVACGDDTEASDLDLLVDITDRTSLLDIAAMELELEALLGVSVQVTTTGGLKGRFRERVLAEAEPV